MNRISVAISPNERGSDRAKHLALAISEDNRFMLPEFREIDLDVQFSLNREIFNAEFKEVSDYVTSALSPQGHLYMQLLAAREAGYRCGVVVFGGDNQVTEAIIDALKTRYRGKELAFNIASYESRLIDFEANCEAIRCPVWRWQASPWKRLLSTSHKILMGGDLLGYRPRPAEGEREIAAAAMCFKGMGPELMRVLLTDYQLCFAPRADYARPIEELPGFGKKRCELLAPHMRMIYANKVRA
jgi:hypothetical protein